jgi:hypothetical protein
MEKTVEYYCVNYKDDARKQKMTDRWETLGLKLNFVEPVHKTDHRLNVPELENSDKRTWSIMLQHLDSIRHFLEQTTSEYCVVCEDDIMVCKYLKLDIQEAIQAYERLQLDVLLLGYLLPYDITNNYHFPVFESNYKYNYCGYPCDLWGSQMYLVHRDHAVRLLQKYTIEESIQMIGRNEPYSPDWTLTKYGKKAIMYPMIAIEEGDTKCNLQSEMDYHQRCFQMNYVPRIFM